MQVKVKNNIKIHYKIHKQVLFVIH